MTSCFWPRCSDSKRCKAFGSCVALHQRAHLSDLPQTSKPEVAAKALVHRFEHESMALHKIQREWLEREITKLLTTLTVSR